MLIVVLNALQITFLVILSVIFVFLSFFVELVIVGLFVSRCLLFRFSWFFFELLCLLVYYCFASVGVSLRRPFGVLGIAVSLIPLVSLLSL
jgi:hypothetical protein